MVEKNPTYGYYLQQPKQRSYSNTPLTASSTFLTNTICAVKTRSLLTIISHFSTQDKYKWPSQPLSSIPAAMEHKIRSEAAARCCPKIKLIILLEKKINNQQQQLIS